MSSSSIFGGAKPVDTAAKEREIEEKLLIKNEPKPQLSAASSITSLNEVSDTTKYVDIFFITFIKYISNYLVTLRHFEKVFKKEINVS